MEVVVIADVKVEKNVNAVNNFKNYNYIVIKNNQIKGFSKPLLFFFP